MVHKVNAIAVHTATQAGKRGGTAHGAAHTYKQIIPVPTAQPRLRMKLHITGLNKFFDSLIYN